MIFYALFFITIDTVINQLWVLPIPFAFEYVVGMLPELSGVTTIGGAVFAMLETYVGEQIGDTLSNEVFVSFVGGLSQFVLKIIYTILYFTIGRFLYSILAFFIRIIFFSSKPKKVEKTKKQKGRKIKLTRKEKKQAIILAKKEEKLQKKLRIKAKKPLIGGFVGLAKGAVTAFASLIVLGGFLNMSESLLQLIPDDNAGDSVVYVQPIYLSTYYPHTETTPIPVASPIEVPDEMDAQLEEARNMISAFNANAFVQSASTMVFTDPNYSEPISLHLFLFDSVFSFQFDDKSILLRDELSVFSETASILMSSEYLETDDLSDITSDEIIAVFTTMSESELLTSLIPLAIEVGSDYFDTPVEIPIEELYAIDWQEELVTLGAVAAVGFDLVNTAGILNDETDLETVTLDGEDVSDLFDSLGDSELVTLGAYVAVAPLLEEMGGDISAIITVPTDLEWGDEFSAFGQVAEAVLNTGITIGDLQSGDPSILIGASCKYSSGIRRTSFCNSSENCTIF